MGSMLGIKVTGEKVGIGVEGTVDGIIVGAYEGCSLGKNEGAYEGCTVGKAVGA